LSCEKCSVEHSGDYASGRFCSQSCANTRVYSPERKEEIYSRISKKLKGKPFSGIPFKGLGDENRECLACHILFECKIVSNRKYCSQKCGITSSKPGNGGLREGGGRSKIFSYRSPIAGLVRLNKDEIRVAKILDYLEVQWVRNIKGFNYVTLDGLNRKYYPDFYLEDFDIYVEYKGWVTADMIHKMKDAEERNRLKLVIIYSNDKRYSDLGINLNQIEKSPLVLKEYILAVNTGYGGISKISLAGSTPDTAAKFKNEEKL